jgi:hypothetical protein
MGEVTIEIKFGFSKDFSALQKQKSIQISRMSGTGCVIRVQFCICVHTVAPSEKERCCSTKPGNQYFHLNTGILLNIVMLMVRCKKAD